MGGASDQSPVKVFARGGERGPSHAMPVYEASAACYHKLRLPAGGTPKGVPSDQPRIPPTVAAMLDAAVCPDGSTKPGRDIITPC